MKRNVVLLFALLILCTSALLAQEQRLNVLIANDDGFDSPGILALAEEFAQFHNVTMVAPRVNQSGSSHSIVYKTPIAFSFFNAFSEV